MKKVISERFRKDSSFIGKICYDMYGTKYVQISRGPSVGTIVCVGLDENDNPMVGWALISPDEKNVKNTKENILKGEDGINWNASYEIAEARAKNFKDGKPSDECPNLPSSLYPQYKHFIERAKSFYNPKKYSKKSNKRKGSLLKVWVNDPDKSANADLTRNINV